MKIEDADDRIILIAAFGYALTSGTYVPSVTAKLIAHWDDLLPSNQIAVQCAIRAAIARGETDDDWKAVLDLPLP